jgi:GNAT superfamily N-acetyltransferase
VTLREARLEDVPILADLITRSARALGRADYSEAQIEGALGAAWGVDSQLVSDRTYFVIESPGGVLACGGWSKRKTLFGGDRIANRAPELLDPAREAARIRAFFVDPQHARQGFGRTLLQHCEEELRAAGFKAAELVATLPGLRLYRAFGYQAGEPFEHPLPNGATITFVPMRKSFAS